MGPHSCLRRTRGYQPPTSRVTRHACVLAPLSTAPDGIAGPSFATSTRPDLGGSVRTFERFLVCSVPSWRPTIAAGTFARMREAGDVGHREDRVSQDRAEASRAAALH